MAYSAADYGPGNMNDAGVNYGWESEVSGASGGYDSGFSWGDTLGGMLQAYTQIELAKTNAQAQTDAIRARELGQAGYYQQGVPTVRPGGGLSISSDILLLGGLAMVAVLVLKD